MKTEPITSDKSWLGQMVSHPLPKKFDHHLRQKLWSTYKIEVPVIQWEGHNLLRVSTHIYNNQNDIDILIYALKSLM